MPSFDCTDSALDNKARQGIEEILVTILDIFARHRSGIGINNGVKVRLTPIDESTAYCQISPTPINLKEDITVELALLH